MKRSRKLSPSALSCLEGRVVPSSLGPTAADHAAVTAAPVIVPGAPQPGNANGYGFGFDPSETLQSGYPVYEVLTTEYKGGGTQIEDRLEVPTSVDTAAIPHSVTATQTTEWISLRNGGGLEEVVEQSTTQGNTTTENVTETTPAGGTETKAETIIRHGHTATINITVHEADGGIRNIAEKRVTRGPKTTYIETITNPDGAISHEKETVVHHGQSQYTTTETTRGPSGTKTVKSTTTIVRLVPPGESFPL